MTNVKFANVNLLYILIPLLILVIIPFFIAIRKKRLNLHNIFSLCLHVVICALIALALSGINIEKIVDSSLVYIVADVSDTTENITEEMDSYIQEYHDKLGENTKLGVVVFGKDVIEYIKPGEEIKSLKDAEIDASATNIQEALSFTSKLFPDDKNKQMILLTDGKETDGNATLALDEISSNNITLDAVYFSSDLKDSDKEIQIQNITGNPATFKGKDDSFVVHVLSNYETTATLTITDNGQDYYNEEVTLVTGTNEVSIASDTTTSGDHLYQASIVSELDQELENNTFYFQQNIHEKCNILLITSKYNDYTYIQNLAIDNATITEKITYNMSTIQQLSSNIEDYISYDQIILSNINLMEIPNYNAFIDTLENLVANFGKSVITLGGDKTYFDGSFYSTKLKDMLPVDINPDDTKQRTSLILLIDSSGSMQGRNMEMAKEGAKAVLDVLTDEDLLGIISFDDTSRVNRALSLVRSEDNRKNIKAAIDRINIGGGTVMNPGLNSAFDQMRKNALQSSNREVIVISDGAPYDNGQERIVAEMAKEGIRVSTIGVGTGFDGEELLSNMAKAGNGEYYEVKAAVDLPQTMLGEVTKLTMSTTVTQDIPINIKDRTNEVVKGISSLPDINGINFSKAKYNATTILNTTLTLDNGLVADDVPIYSYWQYGQGQVASFMSDISSDWSNSLFESAIGQQLFKQMLEANYPVASKTSLFTIETNENGYTTDVFIKVPFLRAGAELRATIINPLGEEQEYDFAISNGQYKQNIETTIPGVYQVNITYINGLNVTTDQGTFAHSYSKEYDKFLKSDNILLWQLTEGLGVIGEKDKVEDLINYDIKEDTYNQYFSKELLILALILFVLDVAIRMLRLKDFTNLFKRKNKLAND